MNVVLGIVGAAIASAILSFFGIALGRPLDDIRCCTTCLGSFRRVSQMTGRPHVLHGSGTRHL
jgi:hypothetical protein